MEHTVQDQDIRRISSVFLPTSEFSSFRTIETGHINHTFRITVSEGGQTKDYLLQNLNTHVFTRPLDVTHNIAHCANFLKKHCPDYPYDILTPIANPRDGHFLIFDNDKAWRMFDFIAESRSLDRITTPQEGKKIGEAFGVFLTYINRDDPNNYRVTIPDFHNFTKRYMGFKKYLANRQKVEDEKARYLIEEIDRYADRYLKLEEMDFPSRIIHHDTKANNVLLDVETSDPKCIIDLDTLMPGFIFSDFGDLMRTVLNPYEEDGFPENGKLVHEKIILNLFDGFLKPINQLLTNIEKEYLISGGKKITLLQVLRFLDDHLKGDVYYQIRYNGHNLDRALSQMYLYQNMENAQLSLPQ